MKFLPLGTILAALLQIAAFPLTATAQTASPTIGSSDPPDTWRRIAQTSATSGCIGSIRSPGCAIDTLAACIARRRGALCEIGSTVVYWAWKDHFLALSHVSRRDLEYRIISLTPLADPGVFNWQERAEGVVQAGDVRIIAAFRECSPQAAGSPRCSDTGYQILWARQDELGWRIVDWDRIGSSAVNLSGNELDATYVSAMIAAATAAQANKSAAEIRAAAPAVRPRHRLAPFTMNPISLPDPALAALIAPDPPGTWREKPQPRVGHECPGGRASPVCVVHSFLTCFDWNTDERVCGPIDQAALRALTAQAKRDGNSPYRIAAVAAVEASLAPNQPSQQASSALPIRIRVAIEFRECIVTERFRFLHECEQEPFVFLDLRRNGPDWHVVDRDPVPDTDYLNLARDGYVADRFRKATSRELAAMIAPPEVGRSDPPDTWHHTTTTDTTSSCLGNVTRLRCTIDTARACQQRADPALCAALGWTPYRARGPEFHAYRIQSMRVLKAGQLTRLESGYALRPGDVRVLIKQRICGLPSGCVPTESEVVWLRRIGGKWTIVAMADVNERYDAANFIYEQD